VIWHIDDDVAPLLSLPLSLRAQLPGEISLLTGLTELRVGYNELLTLPHEIGDISLIKQVRNCVRASCVLHCRFAGVCACACASAAY
jgi:hypothetical protein